jgi:hypothetical protein
MLIILSGYVYYIFNFRFIRKKEDIDKIHGQYKHRQSIKSQEADQENNDFDVEEYELEESPYQHRSLETTSLVVKPEKAFYIPLTDVPYPGEVDSTYDLKKLVVLTDSLALHYE